MSWLQEKQVQPFVLSLSKSHEIIKNSTDFSVFLKLVRLHFPLEMVKTQFNRSFLTLIIKEMPIQSDKSWFSKVFSICSHQVLENLFQMKAKRRLFTEITPTFFYPTSMFFGNPIRYGPVTSSTWYDFAIYIKGSNAIY